MCGGRLMYRQGHNPPVTFGATAHAAGPLCRFATSPHTVGSHPLHKGAFGLRRGMLIQHVVGVDACIDPRADASIRPYSLT